MRNGRYLRLHLRCHQHLLPRQRPLQQFQGLRSPWGLASNCRPRLRSSRSRFPASLQPSSLPLLRRCSSLPLPPGLGVLRYKDKTAVKGVPRRSRPSLPTLESGLRNSTRRVISPNKPWQMSPRRDIGVSHSHCNARTKRWAPGTQRMSVSCPVQHRSKPNLLPAPNPVHFLSNLYG